MRILFVTSNRLGDAVLSTGVLAGLVDRYPEARFTIACGAVPAPIFEAVPRRERTIVMRKGRFLGQWRTVLSACLGTWWHSVVDMRGSATAYVLPTLRRRVFTTPDDDRHRIEQMQAALRLDVPPTPRLWWSPADEARADALVPAGGGTGATVLAIGPTANWDAKTWPLDRFEALVDRLTGAGGPLERARVMIVTAPSERERAAPLLQGVPADRLIDLAGTETLPVVAACLSRARLYVGNDSGLMHLAAAAGAPTLGLFGPSPDRHYRPWGVRTAFVRTPESYETLRASPSFRPNPSESLMMGLDVDAAERVARDLLVGTEVGSED